MKDDLISRKTAIDAVYKCTDYYVGNLPVMIDKADAYKALADLPSAQPKIGKWEERNVFSARAVDELQSARCSVCGKYHTTPYAYYFDNYAFCPNCGAKMEGKDG